MASIDYSASSTSITVYASTSQNANRARIDLDNGSSGSESVSVSSGSCSATFTGLSPGRGYRVSVFMWRDDTLVDGGSTTAYTEMTPTPPTPSYTIASFSITAIYEDGVDLLVTPDSRYEHTRIIVRLASDPNDRAYYEDPYLSGTTTIRVRDLQPNTDYIANVTGITDDAYERDWAGGQSFTTLSNLRPDDWSWTAAERAAFTGQGETTELTQARWNAFIDRVNEFAEYAGATSLSDSVKMGSDKIMWHDSWNDVVDKVEELSGKSTSIPIASSGSEIMGWYFTTLETALNSIE